MISGDERTDAFYNRFSFLYPFADLFLKPQKKILFEEINRLPHGKLLEIGVGNGTHFGLYKKHDVTGIETSAAMLQAAMKNSAGKVQLLRMSGEALDFDDSVFDYVVLSHVVAVVKDPGQMLEEVYRVLKPGGRVYILNHFTPDNWLKWIDKAFVPLAEALQFRSYFRIENIAAIRMLMPVMEIKLGPAAYFKILIFCKI